MMRSAIGWGVSLVFVLAACARQAPPTVAPPGATEGAAGSSAAAPATQPGGGAAAVDLAALDAAWPTEILNGEAGGTKSVLFDALRAGALTAELPLAEGFLGEDLADRELVDMRTLSGIDVGDWEPRPANLPAGRFVERFEDYLSGFSRVEVTEVHTWEIQEMPMPPGGGVGITTREAFWIVGEDVDGRRREDRMYLVLDLVRPSGEEAEWTIAGVRTEEGRTARVDAPHFRDVTDAALPGGYDQTGAEIYTAGGPALGDYDSDGDLDLFMPRMHAPMRLYRNDGTGRFDDVTESVGLFDMATQAGSIAGAFADVDNDGRSDLLVVLQGQGMRVYRNEGATFRDVSGASAVGGPGEWQSIAVADFDGDGLLDAYLANYNVIDSTRQPESYVDARDGLPNVLLRNSGGGRFVDATRDAGLDVDNKRWTYAASWADFDQDSDMDLYVVNDYGPNQLFVNDGSGRFRDQTTALGAEDQANGMGASWLDFDGDLDLDLYVSNMQSFAGHRITRLEHFPGTPEQAALYRRFAQGNTLLRNDGADGFTEWSDQAGVKGAFWAWGSAPLDFDGDGDEDIFGAGGFYTGANAADT